MIENKGALPVGEVVGRGYSAAQAALWKSCAWLEPRSVAAKRGDYGPSRRVVSAVLRTMAMTTMTECAARG
jgi:hypothetical protein